MIHQIVHPRLHPFRRTEVHPVHLTYRFDLLPRTRQAYHTGMEFLEIGFQYRRGITSWVACYENGKKRRIRGRARRERHGDEVKHLRHFVEFFRADIWAVSEAKVDLEGFS